MNVISLRPRTALLALALVAISALGLFAGVAHATTRNTPYETGTHNAGTPNSSTVLRDKNGAITGYGNSDITYLAPTPQNFGYTGITDAQFIALGQALFKQACASCHGTNADGYPDNAQTPGTYPNLIGESPAAVDFWIESGRMPAALPTDVQAIRKQTKFHHREALAIAAWIASLSPKSSWPYIPEVNLKGGDVAIGASLFSLNCAACHTITGDGDALAFGAFAPSLRHIGVRQIAEAIRTGPGNMPRFSGNLTDAQVRDIVKYVANYIEHPRNPGGFGLGGLGPVAEGFIGLALGVGILALAGYWVGERS